MNCPYLSLIVVNLSLFFVNLSLFVVNQTKNLILPDKKCSPSETSNPTEKNTTHWICFHYSPVVRSVGAFSSGKRGDPPPTSREADLRSSARDKTSRSIRRSIRSLASFMGPLYSSRIGSKFGTNLGGHFEGYFLQGNADKRGFVTVWKNFNIPQF